jgi:glycosyltransferase involved in cell wall biosynthesis
MELVSIIIPCYNYGWLLAETLESVAAQTYSQWECIIVDDGSIDNSSQISEAYQQKDKRFRYVYQENKGMSAARNCGLGQARGRYIQFLDADDLLVPQKLAVQVAYLETHPTADLVYGDMRYFRHGFPASLSRSADMQDIAWVHGVQGQGKELVNSLVEGNMMVSNAPLLRAELLRRVGPFAEELRWVEDWQYWVRCAIAGASFHYDPTPAAWALVRVHPTSTSHNARRMHDHEVLVRRQLAKQLQAIEAHQAIEINELGIIKSEANLARHNLTKGSILDGVQGYWRLAWNTGRYSYYLKSIPYWLKARFLTSAGTR